MLAVGLVGIGIHLFWPTMPIATPFAAIALGSTLAIAYQFPGRVILLVNLFAYASLYLLLLTALADLVGRSQPQGFTLSQIVDLGISAAVILLVCKKCVSRSLFRQVS